MKKYAFFVVLLTLNTLFAQNQRPNILFVIADDAGIEMSAYGHKWVKTPAFDRLASEGILFERAYTPNAKCAPSRASILTGRNPWQLDAACNHNIYFPTKFKTFPEVFRDNGYTTAACGKHYGPGKVLKDNGSPRLFFQKEYNNLTVANKLPYGISNNDYASNFEAFLKTTSPDKPWLFWMGFSEPHRFYEYGVGVKNGKKTSDIPRIPAYFPDTDTVRNDLLDYAHEVEYMDSHLGKMLKHLEAAGQLDNTIIIMTSDHGMPFPRVKGNQYESSNHIPFAMRWGKGMATKGRKVADYISFIDIVPTLLEATGISAVQSQMQPITGKSLMPILKSSKSGQIMPERDFVLVGQERHDIGRPNDAGYPIRGMHKNGFLYLKNYEPSRWPVCNPETGYLNTDGGATKSYILHQRRFKNDKTYWQMSFGKRPSEEFYDVKNDSDCVKNLANTPQYTTKMAAIKKEMETKLTTQGDLRMMGMGHLYELYLTHDNVNFYERYFKGEKLNTGWVHPDDYEKEKVDD
jgi:N-sulfoglucosamine sulfohydrolase